MGIVQSTSQTKASIGIPRSARPSRGYDESIIQSLVSDLDQSLQKKYCTRIGVRVSTGNPTWDKHLSMDVRESSELPPSDEESDNTTVVTGECRMRRTHRSRKDQVYQILLTTSGRRDH